MSLLARFLGTIFALFLAAYLIDGFIVESLYAAAIVAILLGIINVTLKPLVLLIALPLQIITLGLFTFVVNALFLLFIASFVEGFAITGFVAALLGGLLIAVVLWILDLFSKPLYNRHIVMAEVKILIEGYARKLENGWQASSSTCLVLTDKCKIITDPGCNRERLLSALSKENLDTKDVDYVFWSHRHPDHVLLAGIFENAKHITFDMSNLMYEGDMITEFDADVLGEGVTVLNAPGHVNEHLSLLVDTPKGKVAIAGDVIWWLDDEPQVVDIHQYDHSQSVDLDMDTLVESRKKLLELADYIIPGHGEMFKVEKE